MAQVLQLVVNNPKPAYRVILGALDALLNITGDSVEEVELRRINTINTWYDRRYLTQDECAALLEFIGIEGKWD